MTKIHARARIIQGAEIALDDGRSHCVVVDQPTQTFQGLGPTPVELCLMSHAGCYATIVEWVAKRMRLQLRGCDVKVEAVKDEETGVIIEEAFDITLNVDAPIDRVQRLHEVTLKNCPVGMLFEKAGVKTTYKWRVQKE